MHAAPTGIGGGGGVSIGGYSYRVARGGRVCLSHNNTKVSKRNQNSKFNFKKNPSIRPMDFQLKLSVNLYNLRFLSVQITLPSGKAINQFIA